MDGILWATHCELNAEALDAAGKLHQLLDRLGKKSLSPECCS